jgi:hypothetical protein
MQVVSQKVGDLDLWGNAATGTFRPLVPVELRRQVFHHLHGAAHPGMRASRRLVAARYVWTNLAKDVTAWARECLHCQRAKVHRHVQVPAQHSPIPTRRFSHIHLDLVGPLPTFKGFTHLFTIIDRTTRWPEVIPLSATTSLDCASALFQGWVSRFGVPAVITSDWGAQFTWRHCHHHEYDWALPLPNGAGPHLLGREKASNGHGPGFQDLKVNSDCWFQMVAHAERLT